MKKWLSVLLTASVLGWIPVPGFAQQSDQGKSEQRLETIVSRLRQVNEDENKIARAEDDLHNTLLAGGTVFVLSAGTLAALLGTYRYTGETPRRLYSMFPKFMTRWFAREAETVGTKAAADAVGDAARSGETIAMTPGGHAVPVDGEAAEATATSRAKRILPGLRGFGMLGSSVVAGASIVATGANYVRIENELQRARSILAQEKADLHELATTADLR